MINQERDNQEEVEADQEAPKAEEEEEEEYKLPGTDDDED